MSTSTLDRPTVTTSVRTPQPRVGSYTGTASGIGSFTGTASSVGAYAGRAPRVVGSYVRSER